MKFTPASIQLSLAILRAVRGSRILFKSREVAKYFSLSVADLLYL